MVMFEHPGLQWFFFAVTITASLLILGWIARSRQEHEPYLFLKLFGYSALGASTFIFNGIRLPLGFLLFLLFLARPRTNPKVKRRAALFGLCLFLLNAAAPSWEKMIYERDITVTAPAGNLFALDFGNHWRTVTAKLDISGDTRLERFEARYESDGDIQRLRYEWTEKRSDGFIYYWAELEPGKSKLIVKRNRLEGGWIQFDRSIPVSRFLQKLDEADLRLLKPGTDFPYYSLKADGASVNYGIKDTKSFMLRENGISPIEPSRLPVLGYWLAACGSGSPHGCDERADYLFDS
ncbi:hypothetical protein PV433_30545 [Paenibacillus sp. GYB004]|uniref:hypothetical protein n=1 Tax=Paenibacillus sp. GYB004 TaxID=2994393 RepID=UPI002F96CE65